MTEVRYFMRSMEFGKKNTFHNKANIALITICVEIFDIFCVEKNHYLAT